MALSLNAGMGTLYAIYSDETAGVAGTVYTRTRAETGGAWSAPTLGLSGLPTMRGIDVTGDGAYLHVALGADRAIRLYNVDTTTLSSWPAAVEVIRSDSPSVSYRRPSIALNFDWHYWIFFIEYNSDSATSTLRHTKLRAWTSTVLLSTPHNIPTAYPAKCMSTSATTLHVYGRHRLRGLQVERHPIPRPAPAADPEVLAIKMTERLRSPGHLTVAIDNHDGRYASEIGDTTYQAINRGSQVSVRLGARTAVGNIVSYYRPYWITGIRHTRKPGTSTLTLTCTDGWGVLERTKAPRLFQWHSASILTIITAILAGLGFDVTEDSAQAGIQSYRSLSSPPAPH